jgi:hypothetical protein
VSFVWFAYVQYASNFFDSIFDIYLVRYVISNGQSFSAAGLSQGYSAVLGGTCSIVGCIVNHIALTMEAVNICETSINFCDTTWRNISENNKLHPPIILFHTSLKVECITAHVPEIPSLLVMDS